MRQRAFVRFSLFTAIAGAVALSAQVTTKFKAEHGQLRTAARAFAIKLRRRVWQGVWHEDYDARRG